MNSDKLNNIIVLYDANKMTLDGSLDKEYNTRIAQMYAALGWEVIMVKDGNKISEEFNRKSTMWTSTLVDDGYYVKEFIDECHKNNLEINVWTVDNKEKAEELISLGVDYITSNILE